jgi:hypothetical protein
LDSKPLLPALMWRNSLKLLAILVFRELARGHHPTLLLYINTELTCHVK